MKLAWAGGGFEQQKVEVLPLHDHPWWEEIMIAVQRLWGDWGFVVLCITVIFILLMFRKSINGIITGIGSRLFGK